MREFVLGCEDFACNSLEKHLSLIDQLKKERENSEKQIVKLKEEIERGKEENALEQERLRKEILKIRDQMQEQY